MVSKYCLVANPGVWFHDLDQICSTASHIYHARDIQLVDASLERRVNLVQRSLVASVKTLGQDLIDSTET